MSTKHNHLLRDAIRTAAVLEHQVATLNLYLAGTPAEIHAQLETLQVHELLPREARP